MGCVEQHMMGITAHSLSPARPENIKRAGRFQTTLLRTVRMRSQRLGKFSGVATHTQTNSTKGILWAPLLDQAGDHLLSQFIVELSLRLGIRHSRKKKRKAP